MSKFDLSSPAGGGVTGSSKAEGSVGGGGAAGAEGSAGGAAGVAQGAVISTRGRGEGLSTEAEGTRSGNRSRKLKSMGRRRS